MRAVPTSTYRLQFSPAFRFDDARDLVPYLDALGVGALYASPYLRARAGSMHGYDVVDHNALNPDVGDDAGHLALCNALRERGLGHVLDFVPNHMGVGDDNPWWRDVLLWGERSSFAHYFDIDWRPLDPAMRGRVLLPFLGDHYGRVLDRRELQLALDVDGGRIVAHYADARYPLSPETTATVLGEAATHAGVAAVEAELRATARAFAEARPKPAAEIVAAQRRLAALARAPEGATAIAAALAPYADAERLDALLTRQHWRLTYWRVAVDEINYRRFFDINDLAGLRVEEADVLAATHALVFRWIAEGRLTGLRIDHIDGLADPAGYANLLQDRAAALRQPLWVVVEKILATGERLRTDWTVAGTTGYEFMNLVLGLSVDARAKPAFDRLYGRTTGAHVDFGDLAYWTKRSTARTALASELAVLANRARRLAQSDRRSSDFTLNALREALSGVVAGFPVYRTYVRSEDVDDDDRRYIDRAIARARRTDDLADDEIYEFLRECLTLEAASIPGARYDRSAVLDFALRFQQYTGPVAAKAVEDTAFYRHARLVALNEVGGDPGRFGCTTGDFHRANADRAAQRPHAMIASATHDHKRGADVRARIAALTEFPADWSRLVLGWQRTMRAARRDDDGAAAPSAVDEYLLYQTVVGTWPAAWTRAEDVAPDAAAAYIERIVAYMLKAAREAKLRTSWSRPNAAYETALDGFTRSLLQPDGRRVRELAAFVRMIAPVAAVSSLAATILTLTAPGVPDVYQGTEWWDYSLVDPDNRRPVDYAARARALSEMQSAAAAGRLAAIAADRLASWADGRVKQLVTWRLLTLRRERAATFLDGGYTPLAVRGRAASHVVAFARDGIVTLAPRLVRRLCTEGLTLRFGDEYIVLPPRAPERFVERITGRTIVAESRGGRLALPVAALFATFPGAVLVPE